MYAIYPGYSEALAACYICTLRSIHGAININVSLMMEGRIANTLSTFKAMSKELISQTDSSNGKVELISRAQQAASKALMKIWKLHSAVST